MAKKSNKTTSYRMQGRQTQIFNYNLVKQSSSINWKSIFYFLLILFGIIGVILLFYYDIIHIGIVFEQNEIQHYIFSLLNGFLLGMYLVAVFPSKGQKSIYIKLVILGAVLTFFILNLGYIGIVLEINIPLIFIEPRFVSNSAQGIIFYTSNIAFFTFVFISSFIMESND